MATGCVNRALLASNHKVIDVTSQERQTRDSHCLGLFELELHAVLQAIK